MKSLHKYTSAFFLILAGSLIGSNFSIASEGAGTSIQSPLVYDDLPSNWDAYALGPGEIDKHKGEDQRKLCFDDDFVSQTKAYDHYTHYDRKRRTSYTYILLKGLEDFRVISKSHLLIKTPETGISLIETKYCKKSLRRTKYLPLNDSLTRSTPNYCYTRNDNLTIMTRQKSGFDNCTIKNIYDWNGPFVAEPAQK